MDRQKEAAAARERRREAIRERAASRRGPQPEHLKGKTLTGDDLDESILRSYAESSGPADDDLQFQSFQKTSPLPILAPGLGQKDAANPAERKITKEQS